MGDERERGTDTETAANGEMPARPSGQAAEPLPCDPPTLNAILTAERFAASFEAKIIKLPDAPGCWLWIGGCCQKGYGSVRIGGATVGLHRVSYEAHKGPIPSGLFVLHSCDVRCCVNPEHLRLGTNSENMLDMYRKGRCQRLRGEEHPLAKLSTLQVVEIRSLRASGVSVRNLASRYGVDDSLIGLIAKRRIWRHV